jgi:hypothetical protein
MLYPGAAESAYGTSRRGSAKAATVVDPIQHGVFTFGAKPDAGGQVRFLAICATQATLSRDCRLQYDKSRTWSHA